MFAFMSWVHSTDVANMLRLQKQSMDILVWFSQRADHFGPYMLYHPWRGAYPGDAPLRVITTVIDALRAYEDIATGASANSLSIGALGKLTANKLPTVGLYRRPYCAEISPLLKRLSNSDPTCWSKNITYGVNRLYSLLSGGQLGLTFS